MTYRRADESKTNTDPRRMPCAFRKHGLRREPSAANSTLLWKEKRSEAIYVGHRRGQRADGLVTTWKGKGWRVGEFCGGCLWARLAVGVKLRLRELHVNFHPKQFRREETLQKTWRMPGPADTVAS